MAVFRTDVLRDFSGAELTLKYRAHVRRLTAFGSIMKPVRILGCARAELAWPRPRRVLTATLPGSKQPLDT